MKFLLNGKQTERLSFRPILESDFKDWLPFHEEPLSTQYWDTKFTDSNAACQQQFEAIFERYTNELGGMNALICKKTNSFIGMCGLLIQEVDNLSEMEIGYSIAPKFWGNGYATEAAIKCKEVAFKNKWAKDLISIIQVDNIPSQKVAIKTGMELSKTTTYKDHKVHIYRINR